MRILVVSDTHGNYQGVIDIIEENKNIDAVIHLGDVVRDCENIEDHISPRIPICYVLGNNDFFSDVPYEKSVTYAGKKFFLTHGHKYGVRSGTDLLFNKFYEGYDVILYGHTHVQDLEEYDEGIILNPGSLSYYDSNYAIIEIIGDEIKVLLF